MKRFIIFSAFIIGCNSSLLGQDEQTLTVVEKLKNSYADSRRYNEVCFLTAHNAYASSAEGWNAYVQQSLSLEDQFAYGVRSFMIDLYWYPANGSVDPYIALCHQNSAPNKGQERLAADSNCAFTRAARFQEPQQALEFFQKIAGWLEADSEAIITVHLESYLGAKSGVDLWAMFREAGVADYVYRSNIHNPRNLSSSPPPWPTLGELRKANKRLIIFSDNEHDDVIKVAAYRETRFDLKEFPGAEMRGNFRAWPKDGRTGKGQLASELYTLSQLLVMNHFYSITSPGHYPIINSCEAILRRVNLCYEQENHLPNFIAVDFVEEGVDGGAREVVLMLNARPPEDFSIFKDPILPEVPFPPISSYDQWAYSFKDTVSTAVYAVKDNPLTTACIGGTLGALVTGSALYCCCCKRRASINRHPKSE